MKPYKLVDSTSYAAHSGLRAVKYSNLELKQVEHFEDDDDNDNDSNYVEDVSVHGSWITRRYRRRQAIRSAEVIAEDVMEEIQRRDSVGLPSALA